ncbi:hypothetical protein [Sorangium sp. So ce1151]|uniref:hypothetical protein n=1 Tax=Sorangium sp. So ce1151 TaxID=3133332 RepID=UPI003F6132FE
MVDPIRELKVRAEILHRRVQAQEPSALQRLRALPELRAASDEALRDAASTVQRKHCLAVVGREVGFSGWQHASRVLQGDEGEVDFGTALYATRCAVHLNHWCASYGEARALRAERGGYLLAYKRHFLVVEGDFIRTLGLDPDDPDWAALGWDWVRPRDAGARQRLYGKLLASRAALTG